MDSRYCDIARRRLDKAVEDKARMDVISQQRMELF